jgi:hypothetical protein
VSRSSTTPRDVRSADCLRATDVKATGPWPCGSWPGGCSTPAPKNRKVLAGQLTDVRALHTDARTRGWDTEAARHATVIDKLEAHLATLDRVRTPDVAPS